MFLRIAYVRSSLHTGSGLVTHMMEIAKRVEKAGNEVAVVCREAEIKPQAIRIYEVILKEKMFLSSGT